MGKVILSRAQKSGCGEHDTVIFSIQESKGNLVIKVVSRYGMDGWESTRVLPLDDAEKFRQLKLASGFREGWGKY